MHCINPHLVTFHHSLVVFSGLLGVLGEPLGGWLCGLIREVHLSDSDIGRQPIDNSPAVVFS